MRAVLAAAATTVLPAVAGQRWIDAPAFLRWSLGSVLGIVVMALGALIGGLLGAVVPGALAALVVAWFLGPHVRWNPGIVEVDPAARRVILLAVAVGICLLVLATLRPVPTWDVWSVWSLKAKGLALNGSFESPVFHDPAYAYSNPDYPTLLPSWQALAYLIAGDVTVSWPLQFQEAWLWTMSAASILLLMTGWGSTAVLLVFGWLAAPIVVWQAMQGYADVPMALLLVVGTLVLWRGKAERNAQFVGGVLMAGAALTKHEGLAMAIVVMGCLLVGQRPWRLVSIAPGIVLAAWLPWYVFIKVHGLSNYIANAGNLRELPGRAAGRLPVILTSIVRELLSPIQWGVLGLACVLILALHHRRIELRLGICVLLSLVLVVGVYLLTPYEVTSHINTSLSRVLIPFVGLLAITSALRRPDDRTKPWIIGQGRRAGLRERASPHPPVS